VILPLHGDNPAHLLEAADHGSPNTSGKAWIEVIGRGYQNVTPGQIPLINDMVDHIQRPGVSMAGSKVIQEKERNVDQGFDRTVHISITVVPDGSLKLEEEIIKIDKEALDIPGLGDFLQHSDSKMGFPYSAGPGKDEPIVYSRKGLHIGFCNLFCFPQGFILQDIKILHMPCSGPVGKLQCNNRS